MKTSAAHQGQPKAQHKGLILALLTVAMFMVVIDFSIIQIALPTIKTQFNVPLSQLQWIVTGYSITYAGFLMLSGRTGDIYGRKKLFISGLVLFSLSSLAGGLAPSLTLLIAARIIQGVGAAIGSATGLSIVMATFPEGPERNKVLSIFSAVLSSGFAAGVVLGGYMTADLGWRSVLLVNVPIGIVAAILSVKYLPESTSNSPNKHLDIPGAALLTSALIMLVYALIGAQNVGFTSFQTLSLIALSVIILLAFYFVEKRARAPLVDFSFMGRNTILGSNALALILSATVGGLIFVQTIYIQQILNYPPATAGLLFLPQAFIFLVTSGWLSSRLVNRFGAKTVITSGMIVSAIGFIVLTQLSISGGYLYGLLPGMILTSVGAGTAWTAISIMALEGANKGEEGLASGLFNTSIQIGGPLGLAILLTLAATRAQAVSSTLSASAALVSGFQYAFIFAAVLACIAVVISIFTKSNGKQADIKAQGEIEVPASPPTVSEGLITTVDDEQG